MGEALLKQGAILDDRFMLKRQLGAGGCGAVWLASDALSDDHDVVLKILHPHFDRYSLAVKQLAREAEVLAQLAHPNIAKPYLFSSSGPHTFLAMEHIEGRSLDQEIGHHTRADKHFSAADVRTMFEELCSAVGHAHSKTIIHRDLKPQNVMVTKRGGSLSVKVLDFGIAKLLEGNLFDATTFGRRLGSMFYMSPEQCKGEPADARSDIFSLGVILFEVITLRRTWAWDAHGRPLRAFDTPVPADGSNALSAVLLRVATAPRPRPSDSRPRLPPKVDEVVARAMAIEPERRYPNVDAFLAELTRALGGLSAAELGSAGENVTVKAPVPSTARGKPLYGDDSDTHMERVVEPEIIHDHVQRSVKVERTEALAEVKEREAKEREPQKKDAPRATVWRVGGREASDQLATAMMAEVEDPAEDADGVLDTKPPAKAPKTDVAPPATKRPPGAVSSDSLRAQKRSEPPPREDSSLTGPTIGVKDAERIMAGFPPPGFAPTVAPRTSGSTSQQLGVRAASEAEAHVAVPAYTDGDAHGTVRGALAPEGPGQNARPSFRGRLPVPEPAKMMDPLITAPSDVVPDPDDAAEQKEVDPNATALGEIVEVRPPGFASSPRAGFVDGAAKPGDSDPNQTPLAPELSLDPRLGGHGGTELLYQLPDLPKLAPEPETGDDLTPIHAAELQLISNVKSPLVTDHGPGAASEKTPPPQLREGPPSALPRDGGLKDPTPSREGALPRELRDAAHPREPVFPREGVQVREVNLARGPTRPSTADTATVADPNLFATLARLFARHRLAVVGLIGMVLAFVVGVMLARWAAEEVRKSAVPVPIEVKRPQGDKDKPRAPKDSADKSAERAPASR